jgi:hypothetical protein
MATTSFSRSSLTDIRTARLLPSNERPGSTQPEVQAVICGSLSGFVQATLAQIPWHHHLTYQTTAFNTSATSLS